MCRGVPFTLCVRTLAITSIGSNNDNENALMEKNKILYTLYVNNGQDTRIHLQRTKTFLNVKILYATMSLQVR